MMNHFSFKDIKVNKVIRKFVLSDLLLFSGWGLLGPIFAIFILDKISAANLVVVGITTSIYWLTKSLIQIPVAIFLDKKKGERDDFYCLVAGLFLAGIAAISFILVRDIPGLYFGVFLQGLAFGLYTPAWSAIFSRHLDCESCSLDWSVDSTAIGIGFGIAAFVGGYVANIWGFETVFLAAAALSFFSAFVVLTLPKLILPKPNPAADLVLKDHTPMNTGQ